MKKYYYIAKFILKGIFLARKYKDKADSFIDRFILAVKDQIDPYMPTCKVVCSQKDWAELQESYKKLFGHEYK